ncbi:hypothetical protein EVAR_23230_1 [Eumeta japonica]|uniref:Uncharacterized protein n=1 Tax=Eumeta variegata TaxID=151549 RepID=A0A4C1VCQ8_EUMVA|nr:hypothetical protein EVAR_23230_1 [Eumeta japonica]
MNCRPAAHIKNEALQSVRSTAPKSAGRSANTLPRPSFVSPHPRQIVSIVSKLNHSPPEVRVNSPARELCLIVHLATITRDKVVKVYEIRSIRRVE